MKVAVYSAKPYDRQFLNAANESRGHDLRYIEARLSAETAPLAQGCTAACLFVNDQADERAISILSQQGLALIALRSAGFNNVDLAAAESRGIAVARVPAYSPHAVAEHTFALLLCVVRKLHRAYNRVREGNFALDGLLGFDLFGKTIGIVGLGTIGSVVSQIALGFGCRVLVHDAVQRQDPAAAGLSYVTLDQLLARSDIITLHCPLNDKTRHLIDASALASMKPGAILLNTSRGGVVDTQAVIGALKSGRLGGLGIDVYEQEESIFFEDLASRPLMDDVFARLLTFPNVVITGHQGFFTAEAMTNIAATTISNIDAFDRTGKAVHEVRLPVVPARASQLVS